MVVDVFRGLEQQTIECFELLKKSKTPFLIVVNKIDRMSEWVQASNDYDNFKSTINRQKKHVKTMLDDYIRRIETQCAENGYNAKYYLNNKNPKEFISIIPVSSKTGEGFPDLLMMIDVLSSKFLKKRLEINNSFTSGYIVEKIKDKKYGNIITCILTNGKLSTKSNLLVMDSYKDVFETKVKYIYQPLESKEVKDKLLLKPVNDIEPGTSIVIKLDTDRHLSVGSKFYVFTNDKEKIHFEKKILREKQYYEINLTDREFLSKGIYLIAPTIGTMIALLNICDTNKIPISGINIGQITKVDLLKAQYQLHGINNDEDDNIYHKRFSVILNYGNEGIDKDLFNISNKDGVKVLTNNIIYNLIDEYKKFEESLDKLIKERHPSLTPKAKLEIIDQYVFIKKDPILVGVKVLDNEIKKGVILETNGRNGKLILGKVISIQKDNKPVETAKMGEEVCIKIIANDKKYEYGRDFNSTNIVQTHYDNNDMNIATKYPLIFNL
jgi:translation initiation factor 5B